MSGILYGVGAVAIVAGALMVGFGIPVNEFSFGNTLIISGVTTIAAGLIVAALGVVTSQLQRVSEALLTRVPARPARPLDNMFGAAGRRDMTGVQFPAKPKSDAGVREPYSLEPRLDSPADLHADETSAPTFAPALRNPEESEVTVEDDVSLSPQHPMAGGQAAAEADQPRNMPYGHESDVTERRQEPMLDTGWRPSPRPAAPPAARQSHSTYFDAMWPAEDKAAKESETHVAETVIPEPAPQAEPEVATPAPEENETQSVAILKSGVVDGMGYTLYVDGSIEAELPQGTLRFASINELRSHLEKNA
jgi:hypothetical protein